MYYHIVYVCRVINQLKSKVMKLTLAALKEGQTVTQGNVSIRLTDGAFLVRGYTGNEYGFETYKEAKADYYNQIQIAENLGLQ